MMNRTIAPALKNAIDFKLQLKPYTKYILDNGVELYTLDAGQQQVTMIEFLFEAGNAKEDKNLIAAATNGLLKNGTTTQTAFEINEHFEYYGSYLSTACGHETASIVLHTLSKNIGVLLPTIHHLITDAAFSQNELQIFIQNNKQRLSVNLLKADFVASRQIEAKLYGNQHPYGKFSKMEDFDAIQQQDLIRFYKQYYLQGKCIIFAAGKLPTDIFEQINQQFGKLPLSAYKPTAITPNLLLPTKIGNPKTEIINDPNGVQAAIRIASNFPNKHHPHYQAVGVLNNIFGGFFGSRLMSNIREDKGYTYGIHSYLQNHVQQSAWVISTEAGRDVCAATIQEVYAEMEILRIELVGEEELLLVKNYMMGSILGHLDGPFQIIGRWKNYILAGVDENYFYNALHTIKNIKAEELMHLANTYLKPEYFYEMVVV